MKLQKITVTVQAPTGVLDKDYEMMLASEPLRLLNKRVLADVEAFREACLRDPKWMGMTIAVDGLYNEDDQEDC